MNPTVEQPDIESLLQVRDFAGARALLAGQLAQDVADLIEGLEESQRPLCFRLLPREQAAEIFENLVPEAQEGLIRGLAQEQLAAILNDMSPDDRTAMLEELPAAVTRQLLSLLSPEERQIARTLLGYPEDSVGRLMTPDFIAFQPDWTVDDALEHVRHHGKDSETLNVIYVIDAQGKLIDDLRMRQLLLAPAQSRISDLMDGNFIAMKATDDQETAVHVFSDYDRVAFPVTDSHGALLGIVTVDDVLDVAAEEATEDMQKIGGMEALEQPYMQAGFIDMVRKRAGWLVLLFGGQLLTINALHYFSDQMTRILSLTLFIPLIISSGGNSGSQAATLVIRAMALGELKLRDWWTVIRREAVFGVTLGLALAGFGFSRLWVGRQFGEEILGQYWAEVSLIVGISLVGVVIWGVTIGSMLPFIMRRLGADPATSSTPFVATIVDVTGLLLYLGVASLVIR